MNNIKLMGVPVLFGLFVGCTSPLQGEWEIEATDADDCAFDADISAEGDELYGDVDVECRLFFYIGSELYYYDVDESRADLEGRTFSADEFEFEVSFYDLSLQEDKIVFEFEGRLYDDIMEGDITLAGSDFGEFEGAQR